MLLFRSTLEMTIRLDAVFPRLSVVNYQHVVSYEYSLSPFGLA